jgi:hypothetical protein
MATEEDLGSFLKWVKGEGDVVVGIEGSKGLSKPIEKALREAGVIFYSFKPADTDRFRKAVLGQNTNNQKDAESVARYAMAMESMGGNEKGRRALIRELRKVAGNVRSVTPAMALMIQESAGQIQRFKREQSDITKMSGLGRREYSTGDSTRMVSPRLFNHRLKDVFMTAARNYVLFNADSRLAGYYRNLVKAGMNPVESTKRVARALVRAIFRILSSLVKKAEEPLEENLTAGESDMASGSLRGDQSHTSDISLSSLEGNKAGNAKKVKRTVTRARRSNMSKERKVVSEKTA